MYQSIMSADLIVPDFTVDHNPATWNQGVGNPFVDSGRNPFFDSNGGGNQRSGRARDRRRGRGRGIND
ncbi:hypothetical protein A2U01_0033103 [Trifolium medium]|uniref:Uncharacterized protein n=1 Tax=Trifolium medium TaxID=97028 RepID=A0A392PKK9_9FABA|nr:hypothetical protein [Trifolium medium]